MRILCLILLLWLPLWAQPALVVGPGEAREYVMADRTWPGQQMAFLPGSTQVATIFGGGKLWDAATGQFLTAYDLSYLNAVKVSPNGQFLAFTSDAVTVVTLTGQTVLKHSGTWLRVAFHPTEPRVLIAEADKLNMFDLGTGKLVQSVAHGLETLDAAAFGTGGQVLALGAGELVTWDLHSDKVSRHPLAGEEYWLSPTGNVLTTLANGELVLRDPATLAVRGHFAAQPTGLAPWFSPDGQLVALALQGGSLLVATTAGEVVGRLQPGVGEIGQVSLRPDRLAVAGGSIVAVLELPSGQVQQRIKRGKAELSTLEFSSDGHLLAGRDELDMTVWELPGGRSLGRLGRDCATLYHLTMSPDGRQFSVGSERGVTLWDVAKNQVRTVLWKAPHHDFGPTPSFSKDGRQLFVDFERGAPRGDTYRERTTYALPAGTRVGKPSRLPLVQTGQLIVRSADGRAQASVSLDRTTVRVGTRKLLLPGVTAAAFGPGHRTLLTARGEKLHLWSTADGSLLATLYEYDGGRDWLVATPAGLFDGTPGARARVRWRTSEGIVDSPADSARAYTPGLLGKLLGP